MGKYDEDLAESFSRKTRLPVCSESGNSTYNNIAVFYFILFLRTTCRKCSSKSQDYPRECVEELHVRLGAFFREI